ncbi:MAG: ATP-dependent endonuclease [Velocimicrobium sp.]
MKISYLHITNFKSIRDLEIKDMESALILVGKNNTGKTVVIDAIRLVCGDFIVKKLNYANENKSIVIEMTVDFEEEDLFVLYNQGVVSKYKKYDLWVKDFCNKLPSFQDGKITFKCIVTPEGVLKYNDGVKKNNLYIKSVLPKIYHIDKDRNLDSIQKDVFQFYDKSIFYDLKNNSCMFDPSKKCNRCFNCIGFINQKKPEELTAYEATRLLEYKLLHSNINAFSEKLNRYFHENGSPMRDIKYEIKFDPGDILNVETKVYYRDRETEGTMQTLSEGLKSIYALSLLEAYVDEEGTLPCIILMEDPENYLHPQLQKVASEILFRLSKKNQVIFSTHSPNLIFNFSSKQIKQITLDQEYYTMVNEDTDVDEILDDLGYTANDLMNVNFVFIVEGKQDKSRLPLILEKYYSEVYDEKGKPLRISIIATNSCTNIKTYANLKYINQLYLKDQFLMIRDSDGKNPNHLKKQLCSYYDQRAKEDVGNLPRVTARNVLILKYYSFENYFLDPVIMEKIGVIKNEEQFYNILYGKFKDYLYKLGSTRRMIKTMGVRINSKQDLKDNMEMIKTYVRGHNLYNIFYGRYHNDAETEILKKYIEVAPRDNFKDILDSIDSFVYFENRKK